MFSLYWLVCLSVNNITQKVLDECLWHFGEGSQWDIEKGTIDYILGWTTFWWLTYLSLVVPSGAQATDHLSPSSSVLCCRLIFLQLYLKSAVSISFSRSLFNFLVTLYFCGPAMSTVVQCCHRFFSSCVQASSIFFFLAGLVRVPDQFVSITLY